MVGYEWNGKRLLPTKKASYEILKLNISIQDIIEVLHDGFDCSSSRRQEGRTERCLRRGKKMTRIVLQEGEFRFGGEKEPVYWIIHVSERLIKMEGGRYEKRFMGRQSKMYKVQKVNGKNRSFFIRV